MNNKIHKIITLVGAILGASVTVAILMVLHPNEPVPEAVIEEIRADVEATLELATETVTAIVEDESGVLKATNLPTVDEVDGGEIVDPENYARGETFDISSPIAFANAVMGRCVIENNFFGAQCVSLARTFWLNYAGRVFSTCGTNAAKGAFSCTVENAGDEFELVTAPSELQVGDWAVFSGGLYGHVGMVMGPPNNGYIALLGQNQGGKTCDEGGSAANIVNISLKNFIGAYRPKIYIVPEPEQKLAPDTGEGLLNE